MSVEKQKKSVAREYGEAIIIAIILAVIIRTFVVQAFKIPSGSMQPTLQIGDHLLVNKFIYGFRVPGLDGRLFAWKTPVRGDIIVFKYPEDPSIDYIKRVIAVAGETVELKNGRVFINSTRIEDPHSCYVVPLAPGKKYTVSCTTDEKAVAVAIADVNPRTVQITYGPVTVPEGKIFVMGDNRFNSKDSRYWGFVDSRQVLGKAFIIYWSWDADYSLFSATRWKSIGERWSRVFDIIR